MCLSLSIERSGRCGGVELLAFLQFVEPLENLVRWGLGASDSVFVFCPSSACHRGACCSACVFMGWSGLVLFCDVSPKIDGDSVLGLSWACPGHVWGHRLCFARASWRQVLADEVSA